MRGITRHHRKATVDYVTLYSARKDGSTMIHWFYAALGDPSQPKLFDIRELSKVVGETFVPNEPPPNVPYELFLLTQLHLAAEFCAKYVESLKQLKGM